jgi:S1-C subfamily serine protease
LGYPYGGDRLLAALRTGERQALLNRYGEGSSALVSQLARRDLIKPLLAQGHVLDMYVERIVYDGASGEGNSGAPIFGPSGRVVGISYGQFVQNESLNYAVPVELAISFLERARHKDMK